MARRKPQARDDRLSARLAKLGGVALAAEEYGAGDDLTLDDDDSGNGRAAPIHDAKGKVDMERLLCDLLRALGIDLPNNTNEAEFKKELYAAAMRKVAELTGNGQRQGAKSSAGTNANPLIPGDGGGEDVQPMYMSLAAIEQIADPATKRIALSLATECDRLNHDRREAAKAHQRQQEARLSQARSRRQEIVNRILAMAPAVQRELEDALNQPGMAFSTDGTDPAEATLAALERRVMEQNPHLKELNSIAAAAQSTLPPAPNVEAAAEALYRYMR